MALITNSLFEFHTSSITENEFVTGHFSGRITKWELITKIILIKYL